MASRLRSSLIRSLPIYRLSRRTVTTSSQAQKREGDISDAFASLSGLSFGPLEPRFADVKARLRSRNEEALQDSWVRLLSSLREEVARIIELGPEFRAEHKKRGVAVIRNVISQQTALDLKQELQEYIQANPHTRAFPVDNPQVYELYWSPSQVKARSHPNLIAAQRFLMQFWHSKDPDALISSSHPTIYADRLRMRLPGDARFALGPHVNGGSCERWEEEGYGRGKVYDAIWDGRWEDYDPWRSDCRLSVVTDMYQGVGACSVFRMFQGWLSLSETGPFQGTLLVNPLLSRSTTYFLLRPFFTPRKPMQHFAKGVQDDEFLAASNWMLEPEPSSWLHGATPGRGQELNAILHPHLNLQMPTFQNPTQSSMVHMPNVNPGDYVSWHCDTIHAVDGVHTGNSDSSVMYIPVCGLTVNNAEFLARQREAFLQGWPCPDFGGGIGESKHVGRPVAQDLERLYGVDRDDGLRAFGFKSWDSKEAGLTEGQRTVLDRANKILGF